MFPAHRQDPWILPYSGSYSRTNRLLQTDKNLSTFTAGHTDTHKPPGSIKTKAQAYSCTNTHLSKMTPRSEKKPLKHTPRDDWPFNSAPLGMFYVQDVACPVMTSLMRPPSWATRFEAMYPAVSFTVTHLSLLELKLQFTERSCLLLIIYFTYYFWFSTPYSKKDAVFDYLSMSVKLSDFSEQI